MVNSPKPKNSVVTKSSNKIKDAVKHIQANQASHAKEKPKRDDTKNIQKPQNIKES